MHSYIVFNIFNCLQTATVAIREERLRQREERVEVKPYQGQGEEGVKNSDVSTDVYVDRTVMPKMKDVPSKLAQLFRNGVFLSVSLASAMEIFLVSGTTVFLPQLIQLQFYQSSGTSAIIAGESSVNKLVKDYMYACPDDVSITLAGRRTLTFVCQRIID
jgi:hypothetical protein